MRLPTKPAHKLPQNRKRGCCKKHDLKVQQLLNLEKHEKTDFISHSRAFFAYFNSLAFLEDFLC